MPRVRRHGARRPGHRFAGFPVDLLLAMCELVGQGEQPLCAAASVGTGINRHPFQGLLLACAMMRAVATWARAVLAST